MEDEIKDAFTNMMLSIEDEVKDLDNKLQVANFHPSVTQSDTTSLVSGIGGFLPIKNDSSSTASSIIKGIGYAPSSTSNSFITSGSSKGLLSLTKSKADKREDKILDKMAEEA